MKKTTSRALTALALGVGMALVPVMGAAAHVGIDPSTAEPGSNATITFTVPNESETAATVSVAVHLPTDTPLTSVRYQPTPGWSAEVVVEALPEPVQVAGNEVTSAPTMVIFTAEAGGGIKPGQFEEFTLRLGPVPDVGSLPLATIQTYDDGEVVNWSARGEEAEEDERLNPAPILYVNDAPPADDHGAPAPAAEEHEEEAADSSADDGIALGLSIGALALGFLGFMLGGIALLRTRRAAR